ncbi:histidine kinase [Robinsoniella peoriensis]|uniref:histidine kinase n=1 Tax=Robinsoniella peoriensis TaxID=180332 RepID=UPI00085CD36D|nr:histidine kinase [Robinsoniella peoriensis]
MKKKRSKSIAFSISIFFISLNVVSFLLFFYLINSQYFKIAKSNILENNRIAAENINKNFDDVRFYLNDLTLKMYSDANLNDICSRIFRGEFENNAQRQSLAFEAESLCYDYLLSYNFIHSVGIFLEDSAKTDIYLIKNYSSTTYQVHRAYREQAQEQVIRNKGAIKCYDVGKEHSIIFARTIKDFKNVLKDDQITGTVMVMIRGQYIRDILKNAVTTPGSYAMLVNGDGEVTYATRDDLNGQLLSEVVKEDSDGGTSPQMLEREIESLEQKLVIVTPVQDISLSISSFKNTLIEFLIILVILNLILVLLISKKLTKPMHNFVDQIQDIGITDIARKVDASGYSEIENIAEDFNHMLTRIQNLVNENYVISLNEKNARIEALQSQINPHFIFNTLDTINWKVMFLDMPEVTNMITCLGDMLRYTTYQYGKYVTASQEILQIKNYLYIQEIRYDHSFEAVYDVEEEALKQVIPCLIIQPLVENAVVHGLKAKKDGVLVIKLRIEENMLKIMVFDNGNGMEQQKIREVYQSTEGTIKESIGLSNVNKRICLTYSVEKGLEIKSRVGHYTRIEILIPIAEGKK